MWRVLTTRQKCPVITARVSGTACPRPPCRAICKKKKESSRVYVTFAPHARKVPGCHGIARHIYVLKYIYIEAEKQNKQKKAYVTLSLLLHSTYRNLLNMTQIPQVLCVHDESAVLKA